MPLDRETETLIKVIALKNALDHGGRAQLDAVLSKLLGSRPDLRKVIRNLIPDINAQVAAVNNIPSADQKVLLKDLAPNEFEAKKSVEQKSPLPPLERAVMGKVVTRFPPEPNGYPHIGHAKAAIIDEEYARMYNGKLILRFDDTNPLKEKLEYYGAIAEGLQWLGVKPDIVKNTSDDISILHDYGKKMVELGGAYVCTCSQERIHNLRAKGLSCECRSGDVNVSERLDKIFDGLYAPNEAIIRFKGDMTDPNTAMRDPTLFRIIEGDHPKVGRSVRVWPTYDFAAPIEDSLDGVTHAMRTKEYELRNALYFSILDRLGLRKPEMIEFSRLEFEGMPVSKRKIKPLIESGTIKSWDDPRLPTLSAFRRRGFVPEAIRKFVLSLGITLAETKPPFEALEAFNRKIIDPKCMRLYFVRCPVEVYIEDAKAMDVTLKNHPADSSLGSRKVNVSNRFFIASDDARNLKEGDELRLIELYNIKVTHMDKHEGKIRSVRAVLGDDKIHQSMQKVQWIAKADIVEFQVMIPKALYAGEEYNAESLEVANGGVESFATTLPLGTQVQFVRFGFCRIDGSKTAILTHR